MKYPLAKPSAMTRRRRRTVCIEVGDQILSAGYDTVDPQPSTPRSVRSTRVKERTGGSMDTIIMLLLLVTAVAAYRGLSRRVILIVWLIALISMVGLFRYHVSSKLHLNF